MSCVISNAGMPGSQIIGGLITLSIHLCKCMWKFTKTFILHPFCERFRELHDFIKKAIFMAVV